MVSCMFNVLPSLVLLVDLQSGVRHTFMVESQELVNTKLALVCGFCGAFLLTRHTLETASSCILLAV